MCTVYRNISSVRAADGSIWYYNSVLEQLGNAHKWAAYPENPNYEASMEGEVRSAKTKAVLSKFLTGGYYRVRLPGTGKRLVSRIVARTFLDNPLGLPVVHHKNGRLNNRVENLEWKSHSGNSLAFHRSTVRVE